MAIKEYLRNLLYTWRGMVDHLKKDMSINISSVWAWLSSNRDTIVATANIILVIITMTSLIISMEANRRSEKLFAEQIKPLVQTYPVGFKILYDGDTLFLTTDLKIVNHSNFTAFNVRSDVKYDEQWIGEWVRAAVKGLEDKKKRGLLSEKEAKYLLSYRHFVAKNIGDLEPKKSLDHSWTGNYRTKEYFDNLKNRELVIRTRWRNERDYEFDVVDYYDLVLTKTSHGGESITAIPHKQMKACN